MSPSFDPAIRNWPSKIDDPIMGALKSRNRIIWHSSGGKRTSYTASVPSPKPENSKMD